MKVYRFLEQVLLLVLLCLCSVISVWAQASGSAASVSRSRAIVNSGPYNPPPATGTYYPNAPPTSTYYPTSNAPAPVFRIPEEVAVEEFINYHKHRLPLPKAGQAVAPRLAVPIPLPSAGSTPRSIAPVSMSTSSAGSAAGPWRATRRAGLRRKCWAAWKCPGVTRRPRPGCCG